MARRKGERTFKMNERDFPHVVSMPMPEGGFGKRLFDMYAWHEKRGVRYLHGVRERRNDQEYSRLCFPDRETAQAFVEEFGGRISEPFRRAR